MIKKVVVFATLAMAAASAETYKVTLFQPSLVQGTELRPGQYKLDLQATKLIIAGGKQSVETTVRIETSTRKFPSTVVRFANSGDKYSIQEIRLGGTKTRLILNP